MSDLYSQAMQTFESRYSDFIALFDGKEFYRLIADEVALSGITKPVTIESIILDSEKAAVALLRRGALAKAQCFGTTKEAEAQILELTQQASRIPRGATPKPWTPPAVPQPAPAPLDRWAKLTQAEFDKMSSAEAKRLRQTDANFRAAVDRLAAAEAGASDLTDTNRVFLRRADGLFFESFKNGVDLWGPNLNLAATMDFPTAHNYIQRFAQKRMAVTAYDVGNYRQRDVAPRPVTKMRDVVTDTAGDWRFEAINLSTSGKQRRHSFSEFLLKSNAGHGFVLQIDEGSHRVVCVPTPGNARSWSSREAVLDAFKNIPLSCTVCFGDGTEVPR